MLDYTAPVRDMKFVINELIGMDQIEKLQGYDEVNEELSDAILEEAAKLAREVLSPLNRKGDLEGARFQEGVVRTPEGWKEAYKSFCDAGWGSLSMSPEYGGQGLPKVISSAVSEMWDASNMSFSLCPLLTNGAIEAIEKHGSEFLRSVYLEKLVSGEWTGTMNLTEPQAGSDLSAVQTKAIPDGEHYRIKGQKIYITYGEHDLVENIIHLVLARTPGAPAGTRGISLFVVPKFLVQPDGKIGERNEVNCLSLEEKMGIHASPTAVMSYGDDKGAVGYLVGEENHGLAYMFTMMNAARHAVGREGVAQSDGSFQLALQHARQRVQGKAPGGEIGAPIIEHPDVKRMLMTMKCQVEAMRALAISVAFSYDEAERSPQEAEKSVASRRGDLLTPVVKGWCTETAQIVTSLGTQIHGGMGFVEETGAAQYQRDARITTIYEGTTGIQASDFVGRKTLRDGGQAIGELLKEMKETIKQMASAEAEGREIRESFLSSVTDLEDVVDWLLQNANEPRVVASAAVNYMLLAGVTCGGWMMTRAAQISQSHLDSGSGEKAFYESKIMSALFYAKNILPQTSALATMICEGSESIAALDTVHL